MLQYNQPITFGRDGTARQFEPSGISFDEDGNQSWTVEQTAQLGIKLPIPPSGVVCEILAVPFVHEERIPFQQVYFYLNGLFQGFITFTGQQTAQFDILRTAFSPRGNKLSLVLPTARSPRDAGLSSDIRALGIALSSITFISK